MRTEQELRDKLKACNSVATYGVSDGPCPFDDDGRTGCCAECSTPSTIEWVLGADNKAASNGQAAFIDGIEGIYT